MLAHFMKDFINNFYKKGMQLTEKATCQTIQHSMTKFIHNFLKKLDATYIKRDMLEHAIDGFINNLLKKIGCNLH